MTEEGKEFTKMVSKKCEDCGKRVSILCGESCKIVAVRCVDCFVKFRISIMEISQLRSHLKKKGWVETPFGRKEVIKIRPPTHECFVLIPARKELYDYEEMVRRTLETVAIVEEKSLDDVLSEILQEEGEFYESEIV